LLGQQNPELLRLINANQADFLALMNEPIGDDEDGDHDDEQYEGTLSLVKCLTFNRRR
jgi:hypothetical protein